MSQKYLGETFDIHGGGRDLIFPHHENEISQSEAATGKPFARYWIHNGFVNINKEKMSKSLGNILTIREAVRNWHPEAIRLFLLSHHYRSPVDFSEESLAEAKLGLDRFYTTLHAIREEMEKPRTISPAKADAQVLSGCRQAVESFQARVEEAMDDDFNTAQALGCFFELQTHLNSLLNLSKGCPSEEVISLLNQGADHFTKTGWIFGLFRDPPEKYLDEQKKEGLKKLNVSEGEILRLIGQRNAARKEKNWRKADEIRADLLAKGIILEDTPSETQWKLKI